MLLAIHVILLSIFVLVTSSLMVTAILNRVRIRPVRMVWYSCNFYGAMARSLVFLLLLLAVVIYAGVTENRTYLFLGIGYITGGICWIIASRISSATLITDFAVIRNTSKRGNVLGWNQVTDFFIHELGSANRYVFLYMDRNGKQERFELTVPEAYQDFFRAFVSRYVEKRTLPERERAYG